MLLHFNMAFHKFYARDADSEFVRAILDYSNKSGDFSDDAMLLQDHRKMSEVEKKVGNLIL